jgi:hypothetical protein
LLRFLVGTAYLAAGASVAIILSADPGDDVRWGVRLLSLALILGLVFTMLLVSRLRLDNLRLLLPWYGIPYLAWLIGGPPTREGTLATWAYAWGLFGTIVFCAATFATLATTRR